MDTKFRNFENSKSSDPHRLLLNFFDKLNLKRVINLLLSQIIACTIRGKI